MSPERSEDIFYVYKRNCSGCAVMRSKIQKNDANIKIDKSFYVICVKSA